MHRLLRHRLLLLALLAGCAAGARSLGEIRLGPFTDASGLPATFEVQERRVLSRDLDILLASDGCIRGTFGLRPVEFCQRPGAPPGAQVWSGSSGRFTLELRADAVHVDGVLGNEAAPLERPFMATLPLGKGPQWDELRRHPALLAVAAASAGVHGEPSIR
jgi:hypothetical protein